MVELGKIEHLKILMDHKITHINYNELLQLAYRYNKFNTFCVLLSHTNFANINNNLIVKIYDDLWDLLDETGRRYKAYKYFYHIIELFCAEMCKQPEALKLAIVQAPQLLKILANYKNILWNNMQKLSDEDKINVFEQIVTSKTKKVNLQSPFYVIFAQHSWNPNRLFRRQILHQIEAEYHQLTENIAREEYSNLLKKMN